MKKTYSKTALVLLAAITLGAVTPSCSLADPRHEDPAAHQAASKKVRKGMTREQVRTLLGEPISVGTFGSTETWAYGASDANKNFRRVQNTALIPFIGPVAAIAQARRTTNRQVTTGITFKNGRVTQINRTQTDRGRGISPY